MPLASHDALPLGSMYMAALHPGGRQGGGRSSHIFTMELVIGGFGGVDARGAQKVEGDYGLLCHLIPQLEGPVFVGGAEATDEVVFEGLYGALRWVLPVIRWGHDLVMKFSLLYSLDQVL